jgi:hypothetical protein
VASDTLPAGAEREALPLPRHEAWQAGAMAMFSVIFEVRPKHKKFDLYLDLAKGLRPILEEIDGFIDNERFESVRAGRAGSCRTRPGGTRNP